MSPRAVYRVNLCPVTKMLRELCPDAIERMRPIWAAADEALRVDSVPHLVRLARLQHGESVEKPLAARPDRTASEVEKRREASRDYYLRRKARRAAELAAREA